MLLNFFLNNVWLAIGLWASLYLVDYIFTLTAARMYYAGVDEHLTFSGGYELNPVFRDDIRGLRLFSFRFWLLMLFVGGLLLILHSLDLPEVFSFVWGMFVCIQIAIHLRHIRNLAVFYHARDSKGMSGRIEYQHWLSLRLSSIELFSFSMLFLFLYLFSGTFFILGGAAGCLSLALRHLFDSFKEEKMLSRAEA